MSGLCNISNIIKERTKFFEILFEYGGIMAVDPVCGVHVDERAAEPSEEFTAEYGGEKFYFCSEDCKRTFEQSPIQHSRKTA